jgi:hypothetical protein
MHLSRSVTLKLLKRQEWGKPPRAQPSRRRSGWSAVKPTTRRESECNR